MFERIARRLTQKKGGVPNKAKSSFAGQWVGQLEDGSPVILDLDDGDPNIRGTGRIHFKGKLGTGVNLTFTRLGDNHKIENVVLFWIKPDDATLLSTAGARTLHPEETFSDTATITLKRNNNSIRLDWETQTGESGSVSLSSITDSAPSCLQPMRINTWNEFKDWALQQEPQAFIFRGQPGTYRLRTSFHRTYRKDLVKYTVEDIPLAYKLLIAQTNHLFDLNSAQQRGAFWNLLQHHGYPTPLLDWSYSPFVAAFFAYRRRQDSSAPSDRIRILALNKAEWSRLPQYDKPNLVPLHFSILDALAIENKRALPQQALSTLTNVDDIEGYIKTVEASHKKQFLYAIDLPASIRPQVMVELSLMGITAGSLFPGLDGACEELRGRMFHHQISPVTGKK